MYQCKGGAMVSNIRFPDVKPLSIDRYAKIVSTGIGLPKRIVTNQDIIDQYNIIASDRAVKFSLGIEERRWISEDESLEGLMADAVTQCLKRAKIEIDKVDKIIYSKLIGTYNIPSTSIGLLKKLKVEKGIPAFDITCACSGSVQAIDMALKSIAAGDDYVIVIGGGVTSDGIQRWKEPNPKTLFLFGDAITAVLLGYSNTKHFISSYMFTNHLLYENAFIPLGTTLLKEDRELDFDTFNMKVIDGNIVLESSVYNAKVIADKLLSESNLTLEDIDYFITSDQSTKIWEAQLDALNIPKEKSLSLFYKYGNTVASMSPLIFDELINTGKIKKGNRVMMMAHGAGATSGGLIFKY
ncbi:UNVERIFIED_CONTAM: 3-oxoacyl-[acyl-carrier-protein] synthase-3 [Acetivibrio alkalicellulosi]